MLGTKRYMYLQWAPNTVLHYHDIIWHADKESNLKPADLESAALPIELPTY